MPAKVIVYWERADWMNGAEVAKAVKKYLQTAQSFGVDFTIVDGDGSIAGTGLEISANMDCDCVADPLVHYVLLEPEASFPADKQPAVIDLRDYVHQTDATYILWSEYGTVPFEQFADYDAVSIPCEPDTSPLWSHVALGILLYDRWTKLG